mmetsp:Transcript_64878/g.120705  ORF Transcript_64878/g.120705 Transcript_64878/m.120705 type:complete len:132 (-) Transcript_64878:121-516(-)
MGVVRALSLAVLAIAAQAVIMRTSESESSRFTVNDIIKINGATIATGDGIDSYIGCQIAPKNATTITVCGCGVKVVANLLTECQPYQAYSEEIGACDCSTSDCVEKSLESGYTDKFNWEAASYEVSACPRT